MGNAIQINRVAERYSSHTQMRARALRNRGSADMRALRERLIAAALEAIAEGGDPRLVQSRVPA